MDPSVTALSDGGFVVTWSAYNGSTYNIVGQRYDALGHASGEFQINTTANNEQYAPTAALSGGGFVVTWMDAAGGGYNLLGQRYDASGHVSGGEFQISTVATNPSEYYPSVAGISDGGFVVTWMASNGSSLRHRRPAL